MSSDNQPGVVSTATPPLMEIEQRLYEVGSKIGNAIQQLIEHTDKTSGAVPQKTDDATTRPLNHAGQLGEIERAIQRLESIQEFLSDEIRRATRLV
jgi:hypothetical protein